VVERQQAHDERQKSAIDVPGTGCAGRSFAAPVSQLRDDALQSHFLHTGDHAVCRPIKARRESDLGVFDDFRERLRTWINGRAKDGSGGILEVDLRGPPGQPVHVSCVRDSRADEGAQCCR
jgi:hypothetical protein